MVIRGGGERDLDRSDDDQSMRTSRTVRWNPVIAASWLITGPDASAAAQDQQLVRASARRGSKERPGATAQQREYEGPGRRQLSTVLRPAPASLFTKPRIGQVGAWTRRISLREYEYAV